PPPAGEANRRPSSARRRCAARWPTRAPTRAGSKPRRCPPRSPETQRPITRASSSSPTPRDRPRSSLSTRLALWQRRRMSHVELTAADAHVLTAYRVEPEAAPRGAVVVVQEI